MSQIAGAPGDVRVQGAEAVLAQLDDEQRAAASAVSGPVCILAGAGTGKTRTITHRIAYGVHTGAFVPEQVLAVTFTARAAGELRSRLAGLAVGGVQARTFHAAAMRQLRFFAPRVLGGPMPHLVENKLRLVAAAASRSRLSTDRTSLRDLASEIEWAKTTLATPDDYPARAQAAGREPPFEPAAVARVYAGYESAKQRDGALDFEDLLLVTAYALEEHPDVARQVRGQYRHFVVDEYQDVNPLQQRLLDAWLGGRADVCVVGDPNQTIYSFTGANPDYLLGFADRYPDAGVVKLERDYRSTPQVVALANRLIGQAPRRKGLPELRLLGQRADGPEPTFVEHPDEPAEAASVALRCRALIDSGMPAAEIAVLFRINAQSQVYEAALADAGVPYVLKGAERFFERPEVREAVLLLRGAAAGGSEPGALVPTLECFDAASKGSVDACWTTPGFHAGKYPVLAFFTTVPFGPQLDALYEQADIFVHSARTEGLPQVIVEAQAMGRPVIASPGPQESLGPTVFDTRPIDHGGVRDDHHGHRSQTGQQLPDL